MPEADTRRHIRLPLNLLVKDLSEKKTIKQLQHLGIIDMGERGV